MKAIGFFYHEVEVDGVKLTDYFRVISALECDILLGTNAISVCNFVFTKDSDKRKKNLAKEENANGGTTVHCRSIKALGNTSEINIKLNNECTKCPKKSFLHTANRDSKIAKRKKYTKQILLNKNCETQ